MTHDNDYAYIEVFINFFERIIEIIMNLFNGGAKKEEAEGELK